MQNRHRTEAQARETSNVRGPNVERRPVVLVVLDGWGWREEREDNAVALADKPVFAELWKSSPRCLLRTDGPHVGLPEGQFGNSEVGHLNLGAGRIVMQDLPRIDQAISDGSLARSPLIERAASLATARRSTVHVLGLVSTGGVHSHQAHIAALAGAFARRGCRVSVHAFLDGRDTPPRSAEQFLARLEADLQAIGNSSIVTLCGRYWAMDRDRRWDRTARAVATIAHATGPRYCHWREALASAYDRGQTDEFVEPCAIGTYDGMRDGDVLVCANFRADRVRQLLGALLEPGPRTIPSAKRIAFAMAIGMTRYSDELADKMDTLFPPQSMKNILGDVLATYGCRQLRLAETEKYPHVTYFFNGGREDPFPGETRILVPSPKVATYDLQPEMSAGPLTDRFVEAIKIESPDFVLINFANPDMVGHTGNLRAAILCVEFVDQCLGSVVAATRGAGGTLLITADHGNCETMRDPVTGQPHTAHTDNPVPCLLVNGPAQASLRDGRLADVAPTILELMGLPQPSEMTGRSLLA
jgi:2,3-bisphosphoglycerate-independent phosphoglycerate mutase